MDRSFRLFDFNIYNNPEEDKEEESFTIQMFGKNVEGKTCSVFVEEYKPFFYVKVDDTWGETLKTSFLNHLKSKIGKTFANAIVGCELKKHKKLYGFDAEKMYTFILLKFANITAFNKVKNLWYVNDVGLDGVSERKLIKKGYYFKEKHLELYEANIPPLLRFFHIQEISPSGWVSLPHSKTLAITESNKKTTCDFEFLIDYNHIVPLNDNEQRIPYKIMSFDIEASSSHGDFPLPVKSYKKLATNIVDHFYNFGPINDVPCCLTSIIKAAFGFEKMDSIDLVYPKVSIKRKEELQSKIEQWLKTLVRNYTHSNEHSIESIFENYYKENNPADKDDDKGANNDSDDEDMDEKEITMEEGEENKNAAVLKRQYKRQYVKTSGNTSSKSDNLDANTIIDIMLDTKLDREIKINELILSLRTCFPALEGDKVTFIGSTLLNYGESDPYLNHCIVLNTCDPMTIPNSQLETYATETEVLLAWKRLVQRENPDVIIGYNIFSFDYEFMFRRAQECDCVEDFLKLSRNKDEICATLDYKTKDWGLEKSSITLASGTYDLSIIKMPGRLQVDMYNWFRRTENLTSYKLDYVGGYFIGDEVKGLQHETKNNELITKIKTNNMTGLQEQSFIHFEEINHSSDYYKDGQKFKVFEVNKVEKWFSIYGHENPQAKKVKWGLAKDDVTPKDIFRMTNEGPAARSVIAKYCIQDCNLVHYLMNKVDVMTDLIEMSKLCSIPMSFLVFRGQGIKLTSYVAKKCREKGVLMPVINKGDNDEGYEGAIVLEPKCGLYLNRPIVVGDFASLYPSSMLSENLCPSSKVWTKIYDLTNTLILETGEKNQKGEYIYDNLPEYEYVNITFDTFRYTRKSPKAKAEKKKSGYKICRFAQFKEGKAIMPSILEELLKARKDTRKLIPSQTDEFMKNVLDKRQLAYKVTANSLYGQLGAKTSTFYEPDIAASTTATGRLLLTYAKRVVEECYQNTEIKTKSGETVITQAEYIYGDTDSVFFTFNLKTKETSESIIGQKALEISIEIAKAACHLVSSFLKAPHEFEYEKTFDPFCLLSKKRYVGIMYEHDATKGKRKEMGIVLKRRDNAPIVKDIYGGIIDILMKEQNISKALCYVEKCLQELVEGNVPIEKLIITKSLRSFYKKPQQIAHKVLADRIASRDPGNKPSSGDRIPFVYVVNKNKKALQGERIETPIYIKEKNLQIDYSFYISNQIMKPLMQLFGLVLEDVWKSQHKTSKISKFKREIETLKKTEENWEDKLVKLKDKEVKILIFDKFLRETNNSKEGNHSLLHFFKKD